MFKSTKKTALGHPNQQIKKYNYLIICDLYKNRDDNCRSQEKQDIIILKNMGATAEHIQKIFFAEGIMISVFGAIIGLFMGLLICLAQQHFGLIKLQGSFAMDAYPVILKVQDFILVFFTVLVIGTVLSLIPAKKTAKSIGMVFNNSISED
jgi:hypothetical protein